MLLSLITDPILLEDKGGCKKFKIYIQAAINKLCGKKLFLGKKWNEIKQYQTSAGEKSIR